MVNSSGTMKLEVRPSEDTMDIPRELEKPSYGGHRRHHHRHHQSRYPDSLRKRRNKQVISLAIDAVSGRGLETMSKLNMNEDYCSCYESPQLSSSDYSEAVFRGIPDKAEFQDWWHSSTPSPTTNKNLTESAELCISVRGRRNAFLKWAFIILNVVMEAFQASITQEASQGKMGQRNYFNLTLMISSICFLMSLVEAFHEGKRDRLVRQRRTFWIYFGIVCSTVQLIVNLISKLKNNDFVKFDYVPLLLSVCYLGSAILGRTREKAGLWGIVKCRSHGYNQVEAMVIEGHASPVFECPKCREDIP